jgi:hypothetical protein
MYIYRTYLLQVCRLIHDMSIQNFKERKCRKIYVLLLDYILGYMSGDNLACKIRELRDENTILKSAYELEDNMVANLK